MNTSPQLSENTSAMAATAAARVNRLRRRELWMITVQAAALSLLFALFAVCLGAASSEEQKGEQIPPNGTSVTPVGTTRARRHA